MHPLIHPVKDYHVILPDRVYERLSNDRELFAAKYEKLKTDVSTFRKNLALQEEKSRLIFQNKFLQKIIPVIDDLFRATRYTVDPHNNQDMNGINESIKANLSLILERLLGSTGLTMVLPAIDSQFDEKTETVLDSYYYQDKAANLIVDIVKPGYIFNDVLLQPAEIIITSQDPSSKKPAFAMQPPEKHSRWALLFHKQSNRLS
jgi:molecular chaperone GrpE (heat shock protein)